MNSYTAYFIGGPEDLTKRVMRGMAIKPAVFFERMGPISWDPNVDREDRLLLPIGRVEYRLVGRVYGHTAVYAYQEER